MGLESRLPGARGRGPPSRAPAVPRTPRVAPRVCDGPTSRVQRRNLRLQAWTAAPRAWLPGLAPAGEAGVPPKASGCRWRRDEKKGMNGVKTGWGQEALIFRSHGQEVACEAGL